MTDPFAAIPAAGSADCEVRQRAFARPEKTCGLVGKPRRKKTDLNPLQRKWFDREGYVYARVETANAWGGMVSDLWGIADYLACHPERREVLLVQVTTEGHSGERITKVRKAPELRAWITAGGRFQVHAWSQPGGAGTRWEMRVREVTVVDGGTK